MQDEATSLAEEILLLHEEPDAYTCLHRWLYIKSRWPIDSLFDHWGELNQNGKAALLDSLTINESRQVAGRLAEMLEPGHNALERDLVLQYLRRFARMHSLVKALIAAYPLSPVNFKVEIVWYLINTGGREAFEFLAQLSSIEEENRRESTITAAIRSASDIGDDEAIAHLAKRFRGFFVPVDTLRIRSWLAQFKPGIDRRLMLQLLRAVNFFDSDAIASASNDLWSRVPEQLRETAGVTGLGPLPKSGTHLLYEFRPNFGFNRDRQIKSIDEITRGNHHSCIVFLDDIIGSGNQALRYFEQLFCSDASASRTPFEVDNLKRLLKFYLALCGTSDGVRRVAESGFVDGVFVSQELKISSRAFSAESGIFDSLEDLRMAEAIARFHGNHLYPRQGFSDESGPGPLGYGNSQALVVFHYNTPNNTLPILWSDGTVNERDWFPLFPRR